jgi:ribosome-binding protein aMBF1 (putative translation factor)
LEEKEIHLVKKVSKDLGMTYKDLAKKIGYSESNLRQSVYNNKISSQLQKAIELYIETLELKEKLDEAEQFKSILKTFIGK